MNITMKHYNIINTFGAVAVVRNTTLIKHLRKTAK